MANTSRNISRACGKTNDEADVMHQAASRHDWVLCGALGCKSAQLGTLWCIRLQAGIHPVLLKADAVHQAVKVERDNAVRCLKKEQCRSVHGAKDCVADVKPSTLEAIIRTCKSRGSIKIEKLIVGVS
jgi:hypothetical protein